MPFNINVGGAWKAATPSVNVGGVWKSVNSAFVNVGGTWRQFYSSVFRVLQGATYGSNSYYAKQSDHVELYAYNPGAGGGECAAVTAVAVDLTGKSTVTFDFALEGAADIRSDAIFIVSTDQWGGGGLYNYRTYTGTLGPRRTLNVNIIGASGSYFIRAHASVNGGIAYWKRVRLYRILVDGVEIWNGGNPGSG
ncbi:hypothetical protein MKY96_33520 [Paenibacillus sp. FSL R7-0302]|uniref:hypothetical protein n=1 Tax=Paenibacillus sp. FSL R7-0302 TaxID=2921681 RepID=UPI0030FA0AE9